MSKLLAAILALLCIGAQAQNCPTNRYLDTLFTVTKHSNVVFANAPSLTPVYVSESVTIDQDITMDIFEPTGDTAQRRPLIIFAFGGGYIFGTKDDSDIQGLCDYFARRGYVTASINYRKGLNVASNTSAVRAIYRAAQDFSAAIRWFKEKATIYKVDTNYIFAGGSSAGSFSAMHAVFMEESDRPQETYASGFPSFNPDLGCISCAGNNYNHSNRVKGILNCWGALLNKDFIDAGDNVHMFNTHGTADPIVPFESGSPFSASIVVQSVDGSHPLHERALQVGLPSTFIPYQGQGHCVWGICVLNAWAPGSPTEFYTPILDSMKVFMYPLLQPTAVSVAGPTQVCLGDTGVYWVSGSNATRYCWNLSGGQLIDHTANYGAVKIVWNTTGNFTASVTPYSALLAAGNPVQTSITVSEYPPLLTIAQTGDTLSVDAGYTYQWYLNQQEIPSAENNTLIIDSTAFYSVLITNAGGCSTMSESLFAKPKEEDSVIVEPTYIAEEKSIIKLYPIPNSGRFIVEGKDILQVSIYNNLGQVIMPESIIKHGIKWVIEHNLPQGVYYVKINTKNALYNRVVLVE